MLFNSKLQDHHQLPDCHWIEMLNQSFELIARSANQSDFGARTSRINDSTPKICHHKPKKPPPTDMDNSNTKLGEAGLVARRVWIAILFMGSILLMQCVSSNIDKALWFKHLRKEGLTATTGTTCSRFFPSPAK